MLHERHLRRSSNGIKQRQLDERWAVLDIVHMAKLFHKKSLTRDGAYGYNLWCPRGRPV